MAPYVAILSKDQSKLLRSCLLGLLRDYPLRRQDGCLVAARNLSPDKMAFHRMIGVLAAWHLLSVPSSWEPHLRPEEPWVQLERPELGVCRSLKPSLKEASARFRS